MRQDEREQLTPKKIRDDMLEHIKWTWTENAVSFTVAGFLCLFLFIVPLSETKVFACFLCGIVLLRSSVDIYQCLKFYRIVRDETYRIVEEPVARVNERYWFEEYKLLATPHVLYPIGESVRHRVLWLHFPISGDVLIDSRVKERTVIGEPFYLVLTNEKKPRILMFYNQTSYRIPKAGRAHETR